LKHHLQEEIFSYFSPLDKTKLIFNIFYFNIFFRIINYYFVINEIKQKKE